MRIPRDDDDIRELLARASASWVGPTPFASRARWAARRRTVRAVRLAAAGAAVGAAVLGLAAVAAPDAPGGAAATVTKAMAHVFTGTPEGTPSPPSGPASPPA